MDSQQLLYIILGIMIFLGGLFWTARRKPDQPTKLNVKAGENFDSRPIPEKPTQMESTKRNSVESSSKKESESSEARNLTHEEQRQKEATHWLPPDESAHPPAKNLGIFFMYNGHDWEAHDVLGIPQGSSLVVATEMYQSLLKKEDPSTFEFYESAYNAILQKRKKERL